MQPNDNNPQQLAYDLRQGYAKIVTEHLVDIYSARKESDYPSYFKALENLYTVVFHKIEKEEDKRIKKSKSFKPYSTLAKEFINLTYKYPQVYLDTTKSGVSSLFESSLRQMERHLYKMMNEANMFGSNYSTEGLG